MRNMFICMWLSNVPGIINYYECYRNNKEIFRSFNIQYSSTLKYTSQAHWPMARLTLTSTNSTLPNFQWSKNLLTCGKFLECDKAKNKYFKNFEGVALSHSRNLPCVSKFWDHWKFGKIEFVLVRVSLAIGQWALLVKIIWPTSPKMTNCTNICYWSSAIYYEKKKWRNGD